MLVTAKNITVRHGARDALQNVSFDIDAGEIVTIVGPNGSGKTTLLRAVVGTAQLSSGTITHAKHLRVGYVPQRLQLDSSLPMTVTRFLSLSRAGSQAQLTEVMQLLQIEHVKDRQMHALSGGQFQRVLLARALLSKPNLLILDEATQGLDQQGAAEFYRLIDDIRKKSDCAVLMVSHELHVVMATSDRVLCLNGHICCQGAPEQVANAPEYQKLFGTGTKGALALYRHEHDHSHDPVQEPAA